MEISERAKFYNKDNVKFLRHLCAYRSHMDGEALGVYYSPVNDRSADQYGHYNWKCL